MTTFRLATLASVSLLVSGCTGLIPPPRQSAPVPQESVQTNMPSSGGQEAVRTLADVQNLQLEVRELRDRIERQEFELERLRNRQRDLYDDLDQRLRARERAQAQTFGQGTPAAPTGQAGSGFSGGYDSGGLPPTAQGTGSPGGVMPSSSGQGGVVSPSTITIGEPGVPASGSATGTSGPTTGDGARPGQVAIIQPQIGGQGAGGPVSASAQEAYDQAFALLKQSRYSDAVQAFEAFIRDFPGNDLTDDAYYWLAEARYVTREFEAALNGFRTVTTNFPDSQRVPASYLKIGYIQYEIGAYADARETLSYIMKNFPTHRVAVSAETRLKKMDREGR